MSGMRIGLVISGRYPRYESEVIPNGVVTYVRGEAKALSDRGHNVTVISRVSAKSSMDIWTIDGVRVVGLSYSSFGGFAEGVHRYVSTYRQDVIEAHHIDYPLLLEQVLGDTPTVTRYASDLIDELYDSYRFDWLPSPVGDSFRQSGRSHLCGGLEQARRSAVVFCAGSVQQQRLARLGISSESLPLGIDYVVESAAGGESLLLIFVGRLSDSRKGGDFLPNLINAIDTGMWKEIVVVAEANQEEITRFLSRVTARNVKVQSRLSRESLLYLIDSAHCVLVPSRSESFGYVFLEPLARGKPVVAFRQKDVVKNTKWPIDFCEWEGDDSFSDLRRVFGRGFFSSSEKTRLSFARGLLWSNLVERYEELFNLAMVRHEKRWNERFGG